MKSLLSALLATAALAVGGNVHAVACTGPAAAIGGASTDDATLSLNGGPVTDSDACSILTGGNGGNADSEQLVAAFGGDPFVRIAKLGESADPAFANITFMLTATGAVSGSTAGTWSLDWSGGPATLDLVLAIHAADRSGAFLFDDRDLVADASGTGSWRIEWLNNGGQVPGFSNMTVWARLGDTDVPGQNPIPLPGTAMLLGAGLLGLGLRRARHNG